MRINSMILALLTASPTARAFTSTAHHHHVLASSAKKFTTAIVTTTTTTTTHQQKQQYRQHCSSYTRLFTSAATEQPITTKPSSNIGTPSTSFDDGTSPFEITTPIYYVNDKPHIGHAYTSLACDVIARYMRHSGRDVYFLSGTDEHGQKVEKTARDAGKDPQTFCDEVSASFRELLNLLEKYETLFDVVH